jgi:hypothetical protein
MQPAQHVEHVGSRPESGSLIPSAPLPQPITHAMDDPQARDWAWHLAQAVVTRSPVPLAARQALKQALGDAVTDVM